MTNSVVSITPSHSWGGYRTELVLITPEMAKQWLKDRHQNRVISDQSVFALAYAIRSDKFHVTPHGIVFGLDKKLRDGQHRLSAIVAADKAVKMYVTYDVPDDVVAVLDQNRPRTVADAERIRSGDPYASRKQAIVAQLYKMETSMNPRMSSPLYHAVLETLGRAHVEAICAGSKHRIPASLATALAYARPVNPERIDGLRQALVNRDVNPGTGAAMLRCMGDTRALGHRPIDGTLKLMRGIKGWLQDEHIERLQVVTTGYEWLQQEREKVGFPAKVVPELYTRRRRPD